MFYREYAPHPLLQPYVNCVWTLEHDYATGPHQQEWLQFHQLCGKTPSQVRTEALIGIPSDYDVEILQFDRSAPG